MSETNHEDTPTELRRRLRLLEVLKDIGVPTGQIVSNDEHTAARWVFVGLAPVPFGQVLTYDIYVDHESMDGDSAKLHRRVVSELQRARFDFEKHLRFILDYGYGIFATVMDAWQLYGDGVGDPLGDYRREHALTIAPGNIVVRG